MCNAFPRLLAEEIVEIEKPLDPEEIKHAMFGMGALKAPDLDGLNPLFFQSQWDVVGDSVVIMIQDCDKNLSKVKEINDTLIVLIPKLDRPSFTSHYRPISLCNVVYKTMTKAITNIIKGVLHKPVAPNQCSFIHGRHSYDNIVIAQEVFHSMHYLKRKKRVDCYEDRPREGI